MSSVRIQPAILEHTQMLAPTMRLLDVEELRAVDGQTPQQALELGLNSGPCWTMLFGGVVGAMFGVCPLPLEDRKKVPDVGTAWLLTGEAVDRNKLGFFRACRKWLPVLLEVYPILTNFVDARNKAALRWAKSLGFVILPPEPYGVLRLPFHQIAMGRW